jgi:hypothetical protein
VSEGGLWRVLEHGTGGLLELGGGGEGERNQVGRSRNGPANACKERQGNNAALWLAPAAPAAPHCNPSHEPRRMHTDVHRDICTCIHGSCRNT